MDTSSAPDSRRRPHQACFQRPAVNDLGKPLAFSRPIADATTRRAAAVLHACPRVCPSLRKPRRVLATKPVPTLTVRTCVGSRTQRRGGMCASAKDSIQTCRGWRMNFMVSRSQGSPVSLSARIARQGCAGLPAALIWRLNAEQIRRLHRHHQRTRSITRRPG